MATAPRTMPPPKPAASAATEDTGLPTQRTVAAAGAPRPTTTAASSVFGLAGGKPKAPPPLDPDKIEICAGVPLPPAAPGRQGGALALALLKRMKPGDSVVLAPTHAKTLKAAATRAKIKVAVRRLDPERYGVWRLE